MMQDSVSSYAEVWIIKEALEKTGSDDPKKVRDALAATDLTTGPAAQSLVPHRIRYDERGRRADAVPVIVQWQGNEPYAVFPAGSAMRKPIWTK